MRKKGRLRAIDLYSGVGGWGVGLRLSDIEVVASYERWEPANKTNLNNNLHNAHTTDIRKLSLKSLPTDIDIVVGSPPCTQFSFSNRGGAGDIQDGLEDIIAFLSIVEHVQPKIWAMENVPRVEKIINAELKPGGKLYRFKRLGIQTLVVNMEDFGLPQRRRRCIAGNFDFNLLSKYSARLPNRTLGDILNALECDPVVDPIFGNSIARADLLDHDPEDALNEEELRINHANKVLHTVYNSMSFPDQLDRAARTITATCTRVSRESIVIPCPEEADRYRRLTIRERACLQGFPITFQFYGNTYSQKLRMVGNAIPPAFTFLLAQVFKKVNPQNLPALSSAGEGLKLFPPPPRNTPPDRPGSRFPSTRTFKFSIPNLKLKSGVRFELANDFTIGNPAWQVAFYFGTSKEIMSAKLDKALHATIAKQLPRTLWNLFRNNLSALRDYLLDADIKNMQRLWAHRGVGGTRAFMLLDEIDKVSLQLARVLETRKEIAKNIVKCVIEAEHASPVETLPGALKLIRNAPLILAGLIVGSFVNSELTPRGRPATSRCHGNTMPTKAGARRTTCKAEPETLRRM